MLPDRRRSPRRPARPATPAVVTLLLALTLLVSCGSGGRPAATASPADTGGYGSTATSVVPVLDDQAALDAAGVTRVRPQVLATLPHDPTAFTQGLEVAGDTLWEGTGRVGRSQLRALDPATGALRRAVDLPDDVFGEGVTVAPSGIWQLTWQDGVVYRRDPATLAVRATLPLEREGWGICASGDALVTSDGSDELVTRDPVTFAPRSTVAVRAAGVPVDQLNELECTPSGIWANVWRSDHLVRIDPATGRVDTVVDAAALRPASTRSDPDAVLNGIARVPGTEEYLLTGKLWPTTVRVRFTPA